MRASKEVVVGKPVIKWHGKHLKRLPPGRYSLEVVQDAAPLTTEERHGILKALRELDAGEGQSLSEVLSKIRGRSGHPNLPSVSAAHRRIAVAAFDLST